MSEASTPESPYPHVDQQPSFPAIEEATLARWHADGTFRASIEERSADDEFVFYDGPPFANGLPHYGHLLTGYVKDAVPRYQTMRGKRVERRFGWDCHGLPAEVETEKELEISGRAAITELGIDKFNRACRLSVLRYTEAWERYVDRQARWVDFQNDYKTLDLPYMESVLWAFKQLWDKGLVYEGFKVLAYCWECETPLSNTETRMDDAYKERQDPALTVLFELDPVAPGATPESIMVWTTTPWTLPSNLALAVGPDIDYSVFEEDGRRYIIGEAAAAKYEKELANAELVGSVKGADLVGRRYRPMFPYFADTDNAFQVLAGDFVSTEDGTGVVHMAPGFGEDDQRLCEDNGIPTLVPMDSRGRFTSEVPDYEGQQVFAANPNVIRDLKARGVVVRHDTYAHSYPHCWRSGTPLVYRGVSSWFVKVTAVRDRMVELNQQIAWVPEHVRDGSFGKWLANARDWPISRNRFWGSPIPVWRSDDPAYPRIDVYGSLDEIERDFGVRPTDLHRPYVDELTRPNPDDPTGKSTMRRVEEVFDCWFESGSMPYAQVHYPFENREWFDAHYPGDFITEYIGQTRGWFYTLHVLATALFDRPAFRACLAHGIVLGEDGQKMSKSLRNYPDVYEMFDKYGSDAMRWFLLSSAIMRGADIGVTERGIEEQVRQVILPIWNAYYFFTLYANTDGRTATFRTDAGGPLDRYILAKTHQLVEQVTAAMDGYDLFGACATIRTFLDALTNWYIRRSRDRFWDGDGDAYDTLYTVLVLVCRTVAPLLPLISDAVYTGLTGDRSVHLAEWPDADELPRDDDLVAAMDLVRDVCSAASSVRKARGLRVRLPLARLTVAAPGATALDSFRDLIEDEVNVKEVVLTDEVRGAGELVLKVAPAVLGPRIGPAVQQVIKAVRAGEWRQVDGQVVVGDRTLEPDEYTLQLVPADETTGRPLPGNNGLVVLDVDVTPELEAEGLARDVVRLIQQARKDAGLHVSDRIHLVLDCGHHDDIRAAVERHRQWVTDQTLALELMLDQPLRHGHRGELSDGRAIHIGVTKAPEA